MLKFALVVILVLIILLCFRQYRIYAELDSCSAKKSTLSSIPWPITVDTFNKSYIIDRGTMNCQQNQPQCRNSPEGSLSNKGKNVIITWTPDKNVLSFRTNFQILQSNNGFIGVGIAHMPYFPNIPLWNAVWLMSASLPPDDYLEVDLFEHNPTWTWSTPKLSVHSYQCGAYGSGAGECGMYLDNTVEGGEASNSFSKNIKAAMPWYGNGNEWYKGYNSAHANNPASWNALVTDDTVMMGVSISGWAPTSKPSKATFIQKCDFVWQTVTRIKPPTSGYHLLVASNAPNGTDSMTNFKEAFWDLRWVIVRE